MKETKFNFSINSPIVKASGYLDADGARDLATSLEGTTSWTLDFSDVEGVSFAALRTLLNARKAGKRFFIVNAEDAVAEKLEDTGVSAFVSVCRKPKPLDMNRYEEFGASFLSKAYNCDDGDSMIKIYGPRTPKTLIMQEKAVARAVMVFGIPTPLVGTLYESEEGAMGLSFERIRSKRSFSRIIAEEPERLEEMSLRFASMCKTLHNTPCDTGVFTDRALIYRQSILNSDRLSEEDKALAFSFLDTVPEEKTCLHGDMQPSNVIATDSGDMWIDLSDFGYGNHMFDMGMWFFLCNLNQEQRAIDLFHFGNETLARIWPVFCRGYFGADTPEKVEEATREIIPFAALHMMYLGATYGFEPGMIEFVRQNLHR